MLRTTNISRIFFLVVSFQWFYITPTQSFQKSTISTTAFVSQSRKISKEPSGHTYLSAIPDFGLVGSGAAASGGAEVADATSAAASVAATDLPLASIFEGLSLPSINFPPSSLPLPSEIITAIQKVISDAPGKIQDFDIRSSAEILKRIISEMSDSGSIQSVNNSLATMSPLVTLVLTAVVTYTIVSNLLFKLGNTSPTPSVPYPMGVYDASTSQAYYDDKPIVVVARTLQIIASSSTFAFSLLLDYLFNNIRDADTQEVRAVELAKLLTALGPSFIKIGQSLSIRTDLLSPAYVRGLKTLQDQVPPFDSNLARQILEDEFGTSISQLFDEFGTEPVAAASLGQVYRAKTSSRNGESRDVAIKIQRPDILAKIALDMYIIRNVSPILKGALNLSTDLVGLTDTWAKGFVDECDYKSEAENAIAFQKSIVNTPLKDVVFAPAVLQDLTTTKILTSEWVVGERLDRSKQEDVTVLCSIAMNTYLTMMLETGLLHCDPHPGNLLRTPEGKLCILDWGMVTTLPNNIQIRLIEHMAHLTSADYDEIPGDLYDLGFIPKGNAEVVTDTDVVETLAEIYGAWTGGGGAASVNVNKVIAQLQDLTATRGNIFQIPPYFAYIAKSFSVLEGIGLSNDAEYSIVNECLPYVSKRLLTDPQDRMGGALGTFIFGPDKNDEETRIIDYERVEQLITGFGGYSTSASGALAPASLGDDASSSTPKSTEQLSTLADQMFDLLIIENDAKITPLQTIFLEQLAKIISSSSRSLWSTMREASGKLPTGRSVLGTLVDPLGLWRTSPVVQVSNLDTKTIETTRNLIDLLQKTQSSSSASGSGLDVQNLTQDEIVEISRILVNKIWSRRDGVMNTGGLLLENLLKLTANKLERGEREIMFLPPTDTDADSKERTEAGGASNGGTTDGKYQSSSPSSPRLENARQLLGSLQKEAQAQQQI